jgi:hypothetical protein
MNILTFCIVFSSLSFIGYVISYFVQPGMKNEFKRFGLEKLGLFTVILELIGALGLLIGIKINLLLIIASLGLGLLMLCGVIVRLRLKDNLWISFPALFYMFLNFYIFFKSLP